MNKVEGKAKDWCKSCQNCHTIKKTDSGMEYICSDPYDGMEKTLNGDSNVTCSMYEARPNPTHVCYEQETKTVKPGEKVDIPDHGRYPWGKDKSNLYFTSTQLYTMMETMSRQKDMENKTLRSQITKLEKEKAELIKASKRKDELIQYYREKLKKAEVDVTTLNSKVEVLDKRNTNQFVIIGEKDKKINTLLNTNKGLTDKIGNLKNKIVTQQSTHYKQCARILELENMVSKLQSGEYDEVLAKDIEIKSLQAKYEDAMAGWKDIIDTNDKLNQTIEDQEITIKALLITIKEMCKDE